MTYFRPTEVDVLWGDATKAREKLSWENTTNLEDLAKIMLDHDLALATREAGMPV